MYIRRKKNKSGSISIQIIKKEKGRYKVVKTMGCASIQRELETIEKAALQEIQKIENRDQLKLFCSEKDTAVQQAFGSLNNSQIQTVGPEVVFGQIFDYIGLDIIQEELFRHLVIARLAFPLSKLKTVEYLYRYQGKRIDISAVYRFMDKLNNQLKSKVEQLIFRHTKKILGGKVSVVFYDMTTLYFEASDEDDLRKTGFSKDGKHQHPQIFLGLLVTTGGMVIAYDIYEGNTYEGHTLIPFIEKVSSKFNLDKPVVIADSGLLSSANIKALEEKGFEYILGARIKNECSSVQEKIIGHYYADGDLLNIPKAGNRRLIINYSKSRAKKDNYNRQRGLKRLEKRIRSGKLTKENINSRGYNKYLTLQGSVDVEIDYEKIQQDKYWDGLKGYLTNTALTNDEVLTNYKELWQIEKAFRMSKTDLRIRPIYHRIKERIEAHICISFAAYSIYKELERVLYLEKSELSINKAAELTQNMYQITYRLPDSQNSISQLLGMDSQQAELLRIVQKYFRVSQ